MSFDTIIKITTIILASAVIGSIISSISNTRLQRKEIVAGATKSALRRVEMYYRIRRRIESSDDKIKIRNIFHDIQEENDYYKSLLSIESVWLGYRYQKFIEALKRETGPYLQKAWKEKSYGPAGSVKGPDAQKYIDQFTKDSRKLFNPFSRVLMRAKYSFRKWLDTDAYE
jgi:hypothetical protein